MSKTTYRTIMEIGTDHEDIWGFTGSIYRRAEEQIKIDAHAECLRQLQEQLDLSNSIMQNNQDPQYQRAVFLHGKLVSRLESGPSTNFINEVMSMIRRLSFSKGDDMNPVTHIPFLNGLLNLETKQLEPFSPDLFFTYQVQAAYMDRHITLNDVPMFKNYLNDVFYETDIPMVLSYFAYSFYPGLPAHRVLFILGRERVGKGTGVRIIHGLMGDGFGSFSLGKILTADRFMFSGIEGKNLLVDAEVKRHFRKGTVKDWGNFNNLFGHDALPYERKGREVKDLISTAKGIVLGNLPFFAIDNMAAIARILIVQTRDKRPVHVIPNLDQKILDAERDRIATLLMQILFKLKEREFRFPGQLTDDSTYKIMEDLADPVENFIEEATEPLEGSTVTVEDAYGAFSKWCNEKGITIMAKQTFTKKFGYTYPKRQFKRGKDRGYEFHGCVLTRSDSDETTQTPLQVVTGNDRSETRNLAVSGIRYRRSQHECTYLHACARQERELKKYKKDNAPKLGPDETVSEKPETKPPCEFSSGHNLNRPVSQNNNFNSPELNADPKNNAVQNENAPNPMKEPIGIPNKFATDKMWKFFLAQYVREHADEEEYHRFTINKLYELFKPFRPDLQFSTVVRVLEEAYEKDGVIIKTAGGYGNNPDVPMYGDDSQ